MTGSSSLPPTCGMICVWRASRMRRSAGSTISGVSGGSSCCANGWFLSYTGRAVLGAAAGFDVLRARWRAAPPPFSTTLAKLLHTAGSHLPERQTRAWRMANRELALCVEPRRAAASALLTHRARRRYREVLRRPEIPLVQREGRTLVRACGRLARDLSLAHHTARPRRSLVLKTSARREFEEARHEHDLLIRRMLVVGRQCVVKTQHKFDAASRSIRRKSSRAVTADHEREVSSQNPEHPRAPEPRGGGRARARCGHDTSTHGPMPTPPDNPEPARRAGATTARAGRVRRAAWAKGPRN